MKYIVWDSKNGCEIGMYDDFADAVNEAEERNEDTDSRRFVVKEDPRKTAQ